MTKVAEKLQNIVMWHDANENLRPYVEFFHRSRKPICFNIEDNSYEISANEIVGFDTYFNSFAFGRWCKFINADYFRLNLEMKGNFSIEIFSIYKDSKYPNFKSLFEKKYIVHNRTLITIDLPLISDSLIAFHVTTFENTSFYCGYYDAIVEKDCLNDVNLSVVSTTFQKEKFILKNIARLKENILCHNSELYGHLYVHVIDNGRTLNPAEINSEHLTVYPNPNVGGSGGFARGMMEALKMKQTQTHVLLMDDDVIVEPESIIRTYHLLRLVKEEYRDYFVSGAMFDYDIRERQYEDVGYVHGSDGSFGPIKNQLDMRWLENLSQNEILSGKTQKDSYAGWWYCCIPVSKIKENGLPLPLFVRGDDVEFSLRNQAKFITMNGICIWHVGFAGKFNAAMELYQVHRNSFIIQAVSGICQDVDFLKRIKRMFWQEITRFSYNNAEQLLDSIDDFLKGPEFIMNPCGEELLNEHFAKNDKMISLEELCKSIKIPDEDPYSYIKLNSLSKMIYVLTLNGHLLPNFLLKRKASSIAYDWMFVPGKNYRRKLLIAINPGNQTGCIRKINRRRCFSLVFRYIKLTSRFKKEYQQIAGQYHEKQALFVTGDFWEKYLNKI